MPFAEVRFTVESTIENAQGRGILHILTVFFLD